MSVEIKKTNNELINALNNGIEIKRKTRRVH